MPKPEPVLTSTREDLAAQWIEAKRAEQAANTARLSIEREILTLSEPPAGSSYINLPDGSAVKIYVGSETEWDQSAIAALQQSWSEISPDVAFPFHSELKPDSRIMSLIREHRPQLWEKFLQPASTSKTKKPAFSVK